jgi:hypothetical protein
LGVRAGLNALPPLGGLKPALSHLQENRALSIAPGSTRPVHAFFCVLSKLFRRHDTLGAYLLPRQFRHPNEGILKSQAGFRPEVEIAAENQDIGSLSAHFLSPQCAAQRTLASGYLHIRAKAVISRWPVAGLRGLLRRQSQCAFFWIASANTGLPTP